MNGILRNNGASAFATGIVIVASSLVACSGASADPASVGHSGSAQTIGSCTDASCTLVDCRWTADDVSGEMTIYGDGSSTKNGTHQQVSAADLSALQQAMETLAAAQATGRIMGEADSSMYGPVATYKSSLSCGPAGSSTAIYTNCAGESCCEAGEQGHPGCSGGSSISGMDPEVTNAITAIENIANRYGCEKPTPQ